VPKPNAFEVEMAMEKLKRHKSPDMDPVLAELLKAGLRQFSPKSINLLILLGIRRNGLRSGRS
jgi:predicted amidophosphoribosyltransferase